MLCLRRLAFLGLCVALMTCVSCGGGDTRSTKSSKKSSSTKTAKKVDKKADEKSGETTSAPPAEGWGNLTGVFVFGGDAPERAALNITKDVEYCGKFGLTSEEVVVNPENKGLQNVVVSLYLKRGETVEKKEDAPTAPVEILLDNVHCRFEPHVSLMQTSQTLLVKNSDEVGHNTKIDTLDNPGINPIIPAGGQFKQQFSSAERKPSPVSCSIHPWMTGYLLITDHPFAAVTDADGKFEIKDLPAGEWTFEVWHEKAGAVTGATRDGQTEEWSRGRFTFTIQPGDNDLGTLTVDPALLSQ